MDITQRLKEMQDLKYRDFNAPLIPNVPVDRFIGVRLPNIRALAKELVKTEKYSEFIKTLPHKYFEEYHLHCFIISEIKDFDTCIRELDILLPYIDNWSVCDSLRPKSFAKNRKVLLSHIDRWLDTDSTYTKRFAIEMLMVHYLGEDFSLEYLDKVCAVEGDDYYLKMMVAWYFATALAKQFDKTLPYIENRLIKDRWTHNKAIQKALESYRVSERNKAILKGLKY